MQIDQCNLSVLANYLYLLILSHCCGHHSINDNNDNSFMLLEGRLAHQQQH